MTSTALINAILSMDAYNRGYGAGIDIAQNGDASINEQIGSYVIVDESDIEENSDGRNIGFYALAYEGASGNTIISYRGTDTFVKDPIYGWTLGGGDANSAQGDMALQFYNNVDDATANTLTTVGHSLGGGLAGYVAGLKNIDASIYDNMAYKAAANNAYDNSIDYRITLRNLNTQTDLFNVRVTQSELDAYIADPDYDVLTQAVWDSTLKSDIYDSTALGTAGSWTPDFTGIDGYYINGEVLDGMAGGDRQGQTSYTLNDGGALGSVDKHSMSTLVIQMFANEQGLNNGWTYAEQYFWPALYNDSLATSIGVLSHQTNGDSTIEGEWKEDGETAQILRTILAYSALDAGEMPFGDTGIRAFYDDANDLGTALNIANNASNTMLSNIGHALSQYFIHFAGQLALNDVERASTSSAVNGVLDQGTNELGINLSGAYWDAQIGNSNHGHVIAKSNLIENIILGGSVFGNEIIPINTVVNEVILRLTGGVTKTLSEGELFVGAEGGDTITGSASDDVILTGKGDDVIRGSSGYDIVDGGDGNDTLDLTSFSDDVIINSESIYKFNVSGGADVDAFSIERINLGSGDDKIVVASNVSFINSGDGDDTVFSQGLGAIINLGAGDDTVKRAGFGSIITTGFGKDIINVQNNIFITDVSGDDKIEVAGVTLNGATKDVHDENPWAIARNGTKYSVNQQGDLVIQDVLGNTTFVANYQNTLSGGAFNTAGIHLFETDWNVARIIDPDFKDVFKPFETMAVIGQHEKLMTGFNSMTGQDPLILDLDGDGLELTTENYVTGQYFDLQGTGFALRTGWVASDDGFLVRDLNGNGVIDNINEMFGNVGVSGYTELALLDSNADDLIDANDTEFSSLKVWRDLNQNAVTDAGELFSLNDLNIVSFNVTPNTTTNVTNNGHIVDSSGQFTFADNTTGAMGDVLFQTNTYDSQFLTDVTITSTAQILPEVKGHGTLPDLRVAMSLNPALETAVANAFPNFNTPDLSVLRGVVTPILNEWVASVSVPNGLAGTETRIDVPLLVTTSVNGGAVVSDFGIQRTDVQGTYWELASGGDVLDTQGQVIARATYNDIISQSGAADENWTTLTSDEITFLERFFGTPLPLGLDNNTGQSAIDAASSLLNVMWGELNKVIVKMASQGGLLATYFDGVVYDANADLFVPEDDRDLAPMLEAIFTDAPGNPTGDQAHLDVWKAITDVVLFNFDRGAGLEPSYAYLFKNIVQAYENVPLTLSIEVTASQFNIPSNIIVNGAETLNGTSDDDIFYLNSDNETVLGGDGSDNYVIGRDFGTDVIQDIETSFTGNDHLDTVRFAHYNASDLTFERTGNDLIITVTGTSHTLTIQDQFLGRAPGALWIGFASEARGINQIIFADGELWDFSDISRNAHLVGDNLDNVIEGSYGIDFLDGKGGNDILSGKEGSDIYIYEEGYGNLTIRDDISHAGNNEGIDLIKFGDTITRDDLKFVRDSYSDDLTITFNDNPDDQIVIEDQFWLNNVITIGLTWFNRIEGLAFSDGSTYSWADVLKDIPDAYSTDGDDNIYGFDTNDVLDGGAGNDLLYGGSAEDTYIFGRGYGHDIVEDYRDNPLVDTSDGKDVIKLVGGLTKDDISISRDIQTGLGGHDNLVLEIKDTNETITLYKQLYSSINTWTIEEVQFDDGSFWNAEELKIIYLNSLITNGDDTIVAFDHSADVIEAGAGDDYISGDGGGDTYIYNANDGHDIIEDDGGTDGDTLSLISMNIDNFDIYKQNDNLVLHSKIFDGSVTIVEYNNWYSGRIETIQFADVTLSNSNDIINAMTNENGYIVNKALSTGGVLEGYDSYNDLMIGSDENDRLRGQKGDDRYIMTKGNDIIEEELGNDTVIITDGYMLDNIRFDIDTGFLKDDLILSISGYGTLRFDDHFRKPDERIENLEFSNGDLVDLDTGFVEGTTGDDTHTGTSGIDIIFDKNGNDTYVLDQGYDYISDAGGHADKILISGAYTLSDITFYRTDNDKNLVITPDFVNAVVVYDHFAGNSHEVEILEFSDGSTFDLTTLNAAIEGTSGNDLLRGAAGVSDDIIFGYGGDDEIYGYAGNDTIYGGLGNDSIYGGYDDDTIYGGKDDDYVNAYGGNDVVYGGDGNDVLRGKEGNDIVFGDDGEDRLYGGDGVDTLYGGAGKDRVIGDDGNDILYGGDGIDTIDGGKGNDQLYGDNGVDTLYGGIGNDILYGGNDGDKYYGQEGADTFVLNVISSYGGNSYDQLRDFSEVEGDTIDISMLLDQYDSSIHDINDFVSFDEYNGDNFLRVDYDGIGGSYTKEKVARLYSTNTYDDLLDVQTLVDSGVLII